MNLVKKSYIQKLKLKLKNQGIRESLGRVSFLETCWVLDG